MELRQVADDRIGPLAHADPRSSAASLAAGAAVWEIAARVWGTLPPFSVVLLTLFELLRGDVLLPALATSLASLVIGFSGAAIGGVTIGLVIGRSRTVEHLVGLYLDAAMSAPTLIYVPLLFALFGVSRASQVAVVFAYAFFIIVTTTSAAVKQLDHRLIDMARSLGATDRQLLWRVALPSARPMVLTGLSLGVTRAVKGMVVGEMVIALSGVGALLRTSGARFDMAQTLALLLVIVLVSVTCNGLVGRAGRAWIDRGSGS